MSYDIGVRLGVDGEQAFRSSINAINANIKAMGTELKAVTAQFARNAASEDALAAKNQVLAKVAILPDRSLFYQGQNRRAGQAAGAANGKAEIFGRCA